MNRLYKKDDIISIVEKLENEEKDNFERYIELNASDDIRRKINAGMMMAYYHVLYELNNTKGYNNHLDTIVIEFTVDELLELSNGLMNSMYNYDEALKACTRLPDAAQTIEKKRNDISMLNQKILSYC